MSGKKRKNQTVVGEIAREVANLIEEVAELAIKVDHVEGLTGAASIAGLKTSIRELASKFDKMEAITGAAINERERERQALVHDLAGDPRVPFTAAELESKPIEELRKLTEWMRPENFGTRELGEFERAICWKRVKELKAEIAARKKKAKKR